MHSAARAAPHLSDATIHRAFGLVAFVVQRHLLDHMRRMSAGLDIDLESMMIWGTLAQINVANTLVPGVDPLLVLDADGNLESSALRPVRLSHLALITGLPRETVRRKLEALRLRGRVERDSNGCWLSTLEGADSPARSQTAEATRRLIGAAEQVHRILIHVQEAQAEWLHK